MCSVEGYLGLVHNLEFQNCMDCPSNIVTHFFKWRTEPPPPPPNMQSADANDIVRVINASIFIAC